MKRLLSAVIFISVFVTSVLAFAITPSAKIENEITRNPDYLYKDYVDEIYDQIFDFDSYVASIDITNGLCYVKIDIRSWNMDIAVAKHLFVSMHRQYPELFFLSGLFIFTNNSGNVAGTVNMYSDYLKEDIPGMVKQVEYETLSVLSEASKIPTDLGKVLYIHNYITLNTRYNEDVLEGRKGIPAVYDIYGVLVDRDAVCQGYAYAFNYFMHRLGIPSDFVRSAEMSHGWSLVKLGDHWYHIDPTFDDPAYDLSGRIRYSYFLRSESGILAEGHSGILSVNDENATTTTYTTGTEYDSLFMQDSTGYYGNISYCGDRWYFIKRDPSARSRNFSICVTDDPFVSADDLEYTVIKTLSSYWYADESYVYSLTYPGICANNGRIYYSTSSGIYSCAMDGTDTQTIVEPEKPNRYTNIYGISVRSGYVYYNFESEINERTSLPEILSCKLPDTPCTLPLTPTDNFEYSTDGVYIWDIPEGATASDIMNSFLEDTYITDLDGNVISENDRIGSGYTVHTPAHSGLAPSYYILTVTGDLNGDTYTNGKDIIRIKRYVSNKDAVIPFMRSADLDGDGMITENDLLKIIGSVSEK